MTQNTPYAFEFSVHNRRNSLGNTVLAFALLLLLLGAGASSTWAQDEPADPYTTVEPEKSARNHQSLIDLGHAAPKIGAPTKRTPLLFSLYASQVALEILDARSTHRALASGLAREGNPLMEPFATHPAALTLAKLGMAAGIIYATDRLYRYHPKLAMLTLGTINTGYIILLERSFSKF